MSRNWNLVEFVCKNCGKIILAFPSRNRKYCSDCVSRKIKKNCLYCRKSFKSSKSNNRKFCCYECAMKFRKGKKRPKEIREKIIKNIPRGKNHYNFKGGIYSEDLYIKIRHSLEMKEWNRKVFKRDNYTCQDCSKKGGDLEAHHIKWFIKIINENKIKTFEQALDCKKLWDIDNGQTLCKDCHNKTKGKYDKSLCRKYK